jgi:hypothetical protein
MKVVAGKEAWRDHVALYIFDTINGVRHVAQIDWTKKEEFAISQPVLDLDPTDAQVLMDSLWDCGVRPTEGAGSAGALTATQKHLDDMRRLVEKTLDVTLK